MSGTRSQAAGDGPLVPVPIRLSRQLWERLSTQATARGKGLSTYVREVLEEHQLLASEIAALRRAVERATNYPPSTSASSAPISAGAMAEVLLLLRSIVGPQKAAIAQKEVERRGLELWR